MSIVLVTGGAGFVGRRCVLQLLQAGHQVRVTLRDRLRAEDVRASIRRECVDPAGRLTFFEADLGADRGWLEAVTGCDFVLHVASPFPSTAPIDESALVGPARDGTIRVLRAARDAGVKRVVMTSSFGAIGYGRNWQGTVFTESDWTELSGPGISPYLKSKTLAEQSAWNFIRTEGAGLELAVLNPTGIFGPVLGRDLPASVQIIKRMLDGAMPLAPRIAFGIVDVRDVADLHLKAMTHPAAAGQRFIAAAGEPISLAGIARVLRSRCGDLARRTPRYEAPDWLVRALARWSPTLAATTGQLGIVRRASAEKARLVLGWSPRAPEETLVATASALAALQVADPG